METVPEKLLDDRSRSVIISMNPSSGSTDRKSVVLALQRMLIESGFDVYLFTDIEEVKSKVAECESSAETNLIAVVAAGGDGTVSLLVNSLRPQIPLAILPLGTENLLAKHLGLSADPRLISNMICDGRTVDLDVGSANGKLFMVMASCGFDADVVQRLHSNRKGHIKHWSYAMPIINSIRRYRYPRIRIFVDGAPKPVTGKWAFIFNVPRYAMNLPIVWDAEGDDGELDLCTFRGGNLFRAIFYLGAILLRKHRDWRYSHYQRFKRIRIEADEEVPFQLDGDPGGILPLEIQVVPQYLRVIAPKNWARPGNDPSQ
ncbi:MAG: diacylglycerol kinase family protein [Mariniblastus sp.]|nr:diacylglycerol kinase family protein [Mariniblastus sp.]